MIPCQCPAGPCEHFPYRVDDGFFLLCRQGKSGKPRAVELRHLEIFALNQQRLRGMTKEDFAAELAKGKPPKEPCPDAGPGTELKARLAELGITDTDDCGCDAKVCQMDRWGVAGCREHRRDIVGWLKAQQMRRGWGAKLTAAAVAVRQPWFRLLDPLGSLVDEALRRAEEKERGKNKQSQG